MSTDETPAQRAAGPFSDPEVSREMLGRWFRAEERLYPVAMVLPERYETVVRLVGRVTEQLRQSCPDIPSLVASDEEALEIATRVASFDPETSRSSPAPPVRSATGSWPPTGRPIDIPVRPHVV
jgi:hypothetical protein